MNPTIIKGTKLTKKFNYPSPFELFSNISLEVTRGEAIAITGPSGVGKSTLLQILGSLDHSSSGELEILGKNISDWDPHLLRSQHIGFVFQNFNLIEDATALDNVLMPARIARKSITKKSEAYEKAIFFLKHVGLESRAHFPARLLSGGEKQRIAIARAYAKDPDFLLADEPSGSLDAAHASTIHELLIQAAKTWNKTLIIVTHNEELSKACDRRLILKNNALVNLESTHS